MSKQAVDNKQHIIDNNSSEKQYISMKEIQDQKNSKIIDGRQILENETGKGGYAIVYKGYDMTDNLHVAIKIFNEVGDTCHLDDFNREAECLSKCNHKNIIRIFSYSSYGVLSVDMELFKNKCMYIVMEYATMGELYQFIKTTNIYSGGLPEPICRYYFIKLLGAVKYCHDNNIAHRDITIQNILLDENFDLKLIDFGLCFEGKSNIKCGTPGFMAPEMQLNNIQQEGFKIDIFSLGVVLFIMYTGHPPFYKATKDDNNYKQIFENNQEQFWFNQMKIKRPLSKKFKDLVINLLQLDYDKRPNINEIFKDEWCEMKTANDSQRIKFMKEKINNQNKNIKILNNDDD